MKIAVAGLWHLGSVTAACLAAAGYDVLGYDPDIAIINQLKNNKAPIYEPGLDDLLARGQKTGKLSFSADIKTLRSAEIVLVTFDTPVDEHDIADTVVVINAVRAMFAELQKNTLVLLSSQLPVGTTRQLQRICHTQYPDKNITFACSPENLRLGKAIEVFTHPERIIVGLQNNTDKDRLLSLFKNFTDTIIWMSIESAEMTKHALNAFLATSVVFINEIAGLCEQVGANAREVELGLKSEPRIGTKAYLRPGHAIAGGTLARDVNYLMHIGEQKKRETPLFSALLVSNHVHKQWPCRRIQDILKDLKNKTIATLGLTYKAGTDTLRRSAAIETCQWLHSQGAKVVAYDPAVKLLPIELAHCIQLKNTISDALQNADAVVITTEWPEFSDITIEELVSAMKKPYVFDMGGCLAKKLENDTRVHYFSVASDSNFAFDKEIAS